MVHGGEGAAQVLPDGRLGSSGHADQEHRVTHFKNFSHLYALGNETFFSLEGKRSVGLADISTVLAEVLVRTHGGVKAGEKITNESLENFTILNNNLGGVEITKGTHENNFFSNVGISTLKHTGLTQHGFDGTETPIIMHLGRQE
jgi:hypothetical protein